MTRGDVLCCGPPRPRGPGLVPLVQIIPRTATHPMAAGSPGKRRAFLAHALFAWSVGVSPLVRAQRTLAHVAESAAAGADRLDVLLAELGTLLRERAAGTQTLAQAEEAERTALRDLAAIETTLRRLVVTRLDVTDRISTGRGDVAALEAALDQAGDASPSSELAAAHRRLTGLVDRLGEAN